MKIRIPSEHLPSSDAWFAFPHWLQDGRIAFLEVEPRYPEQSDRVPSIYESRHLVVGEQRLGLSIRHIITAAWAPSGTWVAFLVPVALDGIENELEIIPQ